MTSTSGGRARRVYPLALAAIAALALAGCGNGLGSRDSNSGTASAGNTSPIVLGMATPTSGSSSAIGPYMSNGAQLAINEINAKGGVLGRQLKLDVQDEACDPKTAVAAANKLVSDKVVASVGGYCSGATLPTLPVFARANIPMVIPAANSDDLVKAGQKNVFLINGTGTQQAKAATTWMTKTGAKRVALMDDNTSYSKNIAVQTAKDLSATSIKVVKSESVTAGESDYSANVTSVLSAKPDFVYWTGYYQEGGLIIRQLRQAGYKGNIMVADGSVDQQLIKIAGATQAEGVFATMTQTPDTIPGAEGWVASYKKTFNADPGPYSTQAYDAVRVVAKAITDAGSADGPKLITALEAIKGLQLFSGPLSFTPQHTLSSGGFLILSVQNGKLALKDPLS